MPADYPAASLFGDTITSDLPRRRPEVLAVFGEPRRMGNKRLLPSFETPRTHAAPESLIGNCI
jgi:hypothetical protein